MQNNAFFDRRVTLQTLETAGIEGSGGGAGHPSRRKEGDQESVSLCPFFFGRPHATSWVHFQHRRKRSRGKATVLQTRETSRITKKGEREVILQMRR